MVFSRNWVWWKNHRNKVVTIKKTKQKKTSSSRATGVKRTFWDPLTLPPNSRGNGCLKMASWRRRHRDEFELIPFLLFVGKYWQYFILCILAAVQQWRSEGRIAVWLHIPILQSRFIAPAAALGFRFHHAESDSSMLALWLGEGPSRLPGYATHQVGVAGQFLTPDNQNEFLKGSPNFLLLTA